VFLFMVFLRPARLSLIDSDCRGATPVVQLKVSRVYVERNAPPLCNIARGPLLCLNEPPDVSPLLSTMLSPEEGSLYAVIA